jgi:hypothetical protein
MMTLMEMIQKIRDQPSMMLGRPSANNLYMFLSGFTFARKDEDVDDFHFLGGFGQYVHDRFRISSTQSWAQIIQFYCLTEADEMALFWKLFDEYVAKKAAKRKKVS